MIGEMMNASRKIIVCSAVHWTIKHSCNRHTTIVGPCVVLAVAEDNVQDSVEQSCVYKRSKV